MLIPYLMFTRHEHSLDGMTAVWLLPVVAAEVAGASGGLLAPHLADPHAQRARLVERGLRLLLRGGDGLEVVVDGGGRIGLLDGDALHALAAQATL